MLKSLKPSKYYLVGPDNKITDAYWITSQQANSFNRRMESYQYILATKYENNIWKEDIKMLSTKIKKNKKEILAKAAEDMLNELYKNEIIDTDMENISIGKGKDYASKKDWIQCRASEFGLTL